MVAAAIELKDIGRPNHLRIPIPEDGGVVLLTGENGVGKSTTLEAVQDGLTNRKDKRSKPRDGVASGSLSGCGIKMTVGRKITRTGELTVETLDGGRLSIADVVSPPYKGELEADGRRIKALVQLAGVVADPELFAGLHPEFFKIIDGAELDRDDILRLADQVKRAFEQHARNAEGQADIAKQKAQACEEAAKDVPVDVETDGKTLQAAFEEAARRGGELAAKAIEAKRRNAEILAARQKITAITIRQPGEQRRSLDEARYFETDAHNKVNDAKSAVEQAEKALQSARWELERVEDRWHAAKRELNQAEEFNSQVAALESIVSAGEIPAPDDAELNAADEAITSARQAIEAGAAARSAKAKLAEAEQHRKEEAAKADRAERLRVAAAGVDQVLTDQIATLGSPLRVEAARLLTDTARGPTFFAELSDGERWRMATEIAVKAVGRGGLLTVPQAAWSELSPRSRVMVNAIAKEAGVVILSAIATDDPNINAVPFEEMEAAVTA